MKTMSLENGYLWIESKDSLTYRNLKITKLTEYTSKIIIDFTGELRYEDSIFGTSSGQFLGSMVIEKSEYMKQANRSDKIYFDYLYLDLYSDFDISSDSLEDIMNTYGGEDFDESDALNKFGDTLKSSDFTKAFGFEFYDE